MPLDRARVDPKASSLSFLYPFRFEPRTYEERIRSFQTARIARRAQSGEPSAPREAGLLDMAPDAILLWGRRPFPEEDLLPQVARYLNPIEGTPATAMMWELTADAVTSASGLGSGPSEWELVRFPSEAGDRQPDWDSSPGGWRIPFTFRGVQLALFRDGIGFLTVGAEPRDEKVASWLDLAHFFRFGRGQRRAGIRARRRTGRDEWQPFFPSLKLLDRARPPKPPADRPHLLDVLSLLLDSGSLASETHPWWREVFVSSQLLPFLAVYVDGVAEADERSRFLYRVRNFFHSRQELNPLDEDLRPDHPSLLRYADGQSFAFSLDGGAFVAFDAPETEFFRRTMPDHLRDHYFLILLLCLHQRFALTSLSEDVAEHWVVSGGRGEGEDPGAGPTSGDPPPVEEGRERAFEAIRDRMLLFTARGYFPQVMQREHHHRCYQKWRETFQLDSLYRIVDDAVRDLHEYVMAARTRRIERLAQEQKQRSEEDERRRQGRWRHVRLTIEFAGLGFAGWLFAWELLNSTYYALHLMRESRSPENSGRGAPVAEAFWLTLGIGVAGLALGLVLVGLRRLFGARDEHTRPPVGGLHGDG